MKKLYSLFSSWLVIILLFTIPLWPFLSDDQKPLTVAESSQFKATSRYEDVMSFIHALQQKSSKIKVETLCVSTEGRKVPLLIIGNPVPSSPADLRYSQKAVVYIQANIHAGEVEGKEASLMLARDLVLTKKSSYLDHLVVLMAPIFNADGNEKISTANRRNQVGPEQGVGIRYNGQNLDLNRDGMKMESPEVQGLVRNVLMRWDPALFIDCHTHNGSYHEEPVTYVWNMNPNGDLAIIEYMREKMIPAIKKTLLDKYNISSIPHGSFIDPRNPEKGWICSGPEPRYLTNYIGLRNRMAILNENYPYVDYKTRVLCCYDFLRASLDYCAAHKDEIDQLIHTADQKTIRRGLNPTENDTFAVEYDMKPLKDKITVMGYEMEVVEREGMWPQVKKTDKKVTYHLPYFADYVPKRSVSFPYGYLILPPVPEVTAKLLQHGILVERLTKFLTLEVEAFKVREVTPAKRLFQGHYRNAVKGEYVIEKKEFPSGTLFVGAAQPLANVAAYLLEPESDDGLLVWNYFDRYLVAQWGRRVQTYPVYKILNPVNLVKEKILSK